MIGDRLRGLRTSRGLSLRQLAHETGLSATLLSQVERGVTSPSLNSLRRLAEAFGQSVSELFEDPNRPPVHFSRPGERSWISSPRGHVQYERIAPSNGVFEVLRGLLQPNENSSDEPWSHESLECVYVVGGTLTVVVDGVSHTLGTGDALTFDSRQPHRYVNQDEHPVEFLLTVSPPTP